MRRRTRWILAFTVLLAIALGGILWVRARSAPEAARLLPPDIEGVIYLHLAPVRAMTHFDERPIPREPDYEAFIRATGFQFERDLDAIAIGIHPPAADAPDAERRFSEALVGRYDAVRVTRYLRGLAAEVQHYRDTEIFIVPHEGRTVRVALLSVDTVAISNALDPAAIRHMIDGYQRIAIPFRGPWLLRANYARVPAASLAWAVLAIDSPDRQRRSLPLPGGVNFTLPEDTVAVASVRYLGSVDFKIDAFTKSAKAADSLYDNASTFLTLFRSIEANVQTGGPDKDVQAFFNGLRLEKGEKRVTLSAEIPPGFLKKALAEAPASVTSAPEPAAPPPAKHTRARKPANTNTK